MYIQPVEPSKVLDLKFDKEDVIFYVRNYLPFLLLMVGLSILFVVSHIFNPEEDKTRLILSGVSLLGFNLLFLVAAITASRIIAAKGKKKYETFINKYGYDNLAAQLKDPENTVFYIHPEKYESYVIVTKEYLFLSRTMMIRLNEIRQMRFDRIARGDTSRPFRNNKMASEITRFIRKVYIVDSQNKEDNFPIALSDDEYFALVNFLVYRLGPGIVYYNS